MLTQEFWRLSIMNINNAIITHQEIRNVFTYNFVCFIIKSKSNKSSLLTFQRGDLMIKSMQTYLYGLSEAFVSYLLEKISSVLHGQWSYHGLNPLIHTGV